MKRLSSHTIKGTFAPVAGFTLIELLVTISIIAVLAAIGFASTSAIMNQARKAKEIGAAKTLISAFQAYPGEHDGEYMPGHDKRINSVELPDGSTVSGPTANRYPFRLAQYYDYNYDGAILASKNVAKIPEGDTYQMSLYPSMGINYQCIGGDISSAGALTMSDTVTVGGQTTSSPIVFASASNGASGDEMVEGYCFITPPRFPGATWSSADWEEGKSSSKSYGNVDGRYGGKAVCAFLDGAVRVLGMDELQDMRLWSCAAADLDDENYSPKRSGGSGRR